MVTTQVGMVYGILYFLVEHPDYEVVTDVGASMISGFGKLKKFEIDHELKIIELIFD